MTTIEKNKKGGGVSILIREGISFKHRGDLEVFEEGQTESVFIEILRKNGRRIILGSLYQPLNTGIDQFSKHLIDIINRAKKPKGGISPELVLGMDHNIEKHATCSDSQIYRRPITIRYSTNNYQTQQDYITFFNSD